MKYNNSNAPRTTITRDMMQMSADTQNVYETVAIIGKRANQISVELKKELSEKLQEYASSQDDLEVIDAHDNLEQASISREYEMLPKSTLIATEEYIDGEVYHRNPLKEQHKG